jgi:hypothetical protein
MPSLFEPQARQKIMERMSRLTPQTSRQWGKMEPAQMLAHCTAALQVATGDLPRKQPFLFKLIAPFAKSAFLSEDKPFVKNSPTDPAFVVSDSRDFAKEKDRLTATVERFCSGGPAEAGKHEHSFLGRITGEQWGIVMYKHLDHHFRQFGA